MQNVLSTRSTAPEVAGAERNVRTVGRWMVTFLGFPAGGLAAEIVVGPVDSTVTAVAGGLLTGAILGAVQAWGLGPRRPDAWRWILATAVGLSVGLGVGATAVDFRVTLGALALMGAVSGLAVGAAQAVVLRTRLGVLALAWPPVLAAVWALGWTITTSIGVEVDNRFTVFGSSGAVVVTTLTSLLPLFLNHLTNNLETSAS